MGNPISACMSFNFLKQSQSSSSNGKIEKFDSLTSLKERNFMTDFLNFL